MSVWFVRPRIIPGWCLAVGPLRVRWVGRDHQPLYSERVGHTRSGGSGSGGCQMAEPETTEELLADWPETSGLIPQAVHDAMRQALAESVERQGTLARALERAAEDARNADG